jgi:hypothetical protein
MYESAIQFEADLSFIFLVSDLFLLPVRNYSVRVIHIWVRTLQDIQLIWFGYIARPHPSGEEEGILLFQMMSTCLRGT